MKPKIQILKFIQKAYADASQPNGPEVGKEPGNQSARNEIIQELFEGMSTGTARIIIEQEVSRHIEDEFNIEQVENEGRYYIATIVRPDGSTIQRLLVDKQTGRVRMIGR